MLNFLVNKFIKNKDFSKKSNRDKLIKITGLLGLLINIFLFALKLIIGTLSGSISIISDSINNLSDSMTSIVTIYGAKLSAKPADDDHPYGHGRSEYLATMIVGMIIIIIGFQLLLTSVKDIFNPSVINSNIWTMIILIVSILLKFYMYTYNKKVHSLTDSLLNKTVATDSLNDVITTTMVFVSILLQKFQGLNIDGYVGLIISIIIIKSGIEIFAEISAILLGKKIDKSVEEKLIKIVFDGEYIKGVHKVELHEYGKDQIYGSCHADVPANIDVYTIHSEIDKVENRVREELGIELNIHIDPNYLLDEDKFVKIEDVSLLDEIDKWKQKYMK